jgi:hypothetical protein
MKPQFWKLSQGLKEFEFCDIIESISSGLVYVHKDTAAKGGSSSSQAEDFINAPIGDYFYLTHGNTGMYLIGQFAGPANLFSKYGDGWLERRFDFVFPSVSKDSYSGGHKWWTPNDNSTFTKVPANELIQFEQEILIPFFNVKLKKFGL